MSVAICCSFKHHTFTYVRTYVRTCICVYSFEKVNRMKISLSNSAIESTFVFYAHERNANQKKIFFHQKTTNKVEKEIITIRFHQFENQYFFKILLATNEKCYELFLFISGLSLYNKKKASSVFANRIKNLVTKT